MSSKSQDTLVIIRKKRGTPVIREHYVRDDIPCRIEPCGLCDQSLSDTHCMLTNDLTHYIIPDVSVIEKFYEVLEHPQLRGLIISQTTCKHLKSIVGKRIFSRFMKSMSLPLKNSIHFSNEHQLECYTPRQEHQTLSDWQKKLISDMVLWYSHHLEMIGINVSLILLTELDTQEYNISNDHPSIQVLTLSDYLQTHFNGRDTNLHQLYDSILTTSSSCNKDGTNSGSTCTDYSEYIGAEKLREKIQLGHLIEGKLRVNRYHPREEAFVTPNNSAIQSDVLNHPLYKDILVSGTINRNRAIHGDTVVVQLLPTSEWKGTSKHMSHSTTDEGSHDVSHDISCDKNVRPTGKVVGILMRCSQDIVASFPEEEGLSNQRMERVLVIPYDIKIPKIRINTRLATQLRDHRIVVRIDGWDINSQYPNGHFVRSIGPAGDIETETQAILIEHQLIRGSFTQSILSELPSGDDWCIEEEEMTHRRDLRCTHLIFSIDPEGCEDVDDTLSVRLLNNGLIELGVHIADVSHFVKPDSCTDREAKERSVTVYLADRRYDMLPSVLSANLCSLLSNVDRYAVSVIWTLSPDNYKVNDVWYGRTLIRSAYKLTYEVAQDLYEGKSSNDEIIKLIPELQHTLTDDIQYKVKELRWAVKHLVDIARVLREKRNRQGALELEGVEVKIQLKNKQDIEDILPKQPLEMHETVAECMIFANHWVAKKIYQHFPTHALLRNHSSPQSDQFNELHLCASVHHFSIDVTSNISLAQSLDRAVDQRDGNINKVLRMLATRAMVQALYISTGCTTNEGDMSHYGLGLDQYTHFTSPIRRYADLIVHRQLLAAVRGELHPLLPTNSELMDTCSHMNEKNRAAKRAQSDSTSLFQALYFLKGDEDRGITQAIVYSIRANGIMAYVPRYGIQGPVYLQNKNGLVLCELERDTLSWNEGTISFTDRTITVSSSFGKYTISLLDHVLVNVKVDQSNTAHPLSLCMELVGLYKTTTSNAISGLKQNKLELIQAVRSEVNAELISERETSYLTEYSQQKDSLYELIERMHAIGIRDNIA